MSPFLSLSLILLSFLIGIFDSKILTSRYFEFFCIFGYILNLELLVNSDQPTAILALNIQRPKLGYPAVVYTNKYSNPVQRLIDQSTLGVTVNLADLNKRPRRKQRGIATLFLTFHAPQGAGNLPVILLKKE